MGAARPPLAIASAPNPAPAAVAQTMYAAPSGWSKPNSTLATATPNSRCTAPRKNTSSDTAEPSASTRISTTPRPGPMPDSSASHARRRPRSRKSRRAHGAVTSGSVTARPAPALTPASSAPVDGSAAAPRPRPRAALHAAVAATSSALAASSTRRGVQCMCAMLDRSRDRVKRSGDRKAGTLGELFRMWSNTRMVVLTAICAALYAALLIPFKVVPLIPGITEFRPANAMPVVCSFLFGPAAAWGAAFGNLIGDFFGGLGPGDVFGFLGKLLYGLVPYAIWDALTDVPPVPGGLVVSAGLLAVMAVACTLCAAVVGWGLHLLGFHPFTVLGTVVLVNNLVVAAVLAPFLLAVLYPRVQRARLLYRDLLGPRRPLPRWRGVLGSALVVAGTGAAFAAGELIAAGRWVAPW